MLTILITLQGKLEITPFPFDINTDEFLAEVHCNVVSFRLNKLVDGQA